MNSGGIPKKGKRKKERRSEKSDRHPGVPLSLHIADKEGCIERGGENTI